MATGSGKTRVVIALVDLLMRCNWVKRVLFLADRISLVKQASKEFGKHLHNTQVVNLLKDHDANGRVYVSTYQTILNQINKLDNQTRKFGIGFFDLVIGDFLNRKKKSLKDSFAPRLNFQCSKSKLYILVTD